MCAKAAIGLGRTSGRSRPVRDVPRKLAEVKDPRADPQTSLQPPRIPAELVVRFASGDDGAFEKVFECIRGDIFNVVRGFFSGAFDQEEAFQEAWLQLHRARGRFDVEKHEAFVSWARQVARNRCIDLLRSRRASREVLEGDMDARVDERASAVQPGADAEGGLRVVLDRFLARLDEEERRHFELCFERELPHEEIAREMGISERRSKYLKKKLLEKLARSERLARREGARS
jgi:RNA polymerase sigma-70 factor (ECF subfamily)